MRRCPEKCSYWTIGMHEHAMFRYCPFCGIKTERF